MGPRGKAIILSTLSLGKPPMSLAVELPPVFYAVEAWNIMRKDATDSAPHKRDCERMRMPDEDERAALLTM